jgi:hypothetical protein
MKLPFLLQFYKYCVVAYLGNVTSQQSNKLQFSSWVSLLDSSAEGNMNRILLVADDFMKIYYIIL